MIQVNSLEGSEHVANVRCVELPIVVLAVLGSAGLLIVDAKVAVVLILAVPLVFLSLVKFLTFGRLFIAFILAYPAMAYQEQFANSTTLEVFGLNFSALDLLIFLILGAYLVRLPISRTELRLNWHHIGLVLLIFVPALVAFANGIIHGCPFQQIGVDFRPFFSILLYFPLRRIIISSHWQTIARTMILGVIALWGIGFFLSFWFKDFLLFLNSGSFGEGTARLTIANSYPETMLLSSLIIVEMFSKNVRTRGFLGSVVLVSALVVTLNVYGSRNLLFIAVLQVPLVLMFVASSKRKIRLGSLLKTGAVLVTIMICVIGVSQFYVEEFSTEVDVFYTKIVNAYDMVFAPQDVEYKTESIVTRIETNRYLWGELTEKPILGYGFGYVAPLVNYAGKVSKEGSAVDNLYLYLGLKGGVLGLVGFLVFIAILVKNSLTLYRKDSNNHWSLVFIVYGISILVSGIFSSTVVRCHAGWVVFVIWIIFLEKFGRSPGPIRFNAALEFLSPQNAGGCLMPAKRRAPKCGHRVSGVRLQGAAQLSALRSTGISADSPHISLCKGQL